MQLEYQSLFYLMFLNQYKNKKKIGYKMYLVEDIKSGAHYALRLRSKQQIAEYQLSYCRGEITCMKELNSAYIVKLQREAEDEKNQYIIQEYCEENSLIEYQQKLPNKVFPLELVTKVLAKVITAMEYMHSKHYVHRDIKMQNIKVKKENGEEVFKLSSFYFSKKVEDIKGTILGTSGFISPQIYAGGDHYGYEVDVWAFGVMFFFMLNMESFIPQFSDDKFLQNSQILRNIGLNFSYRAAVQQSKKKLKENCTQQMEDFFQSHFSSIGQVKNNFFSNERAPFIQKVVRFDKTPQQFNNFDV